MRYLGLLCCCLLILQSCNKDDETPLAPANGQASAFYNPSNTDRNPPEFRLVATSREGLANPKDLDFNKAPGRTNELWVLNPGTFGTGGNTVMITNPGSSSQAVDVRTDGNNFHFMAMATSLDFSETGDWATAQGIFDANRGSTGFTGPSLWSGDLDIYARIGNDPTPEVNGSHLDMVHQSPYGMGICNLRGNEYFVFNGYHGVLTYYDFVEPHYPGGYDHSDAIVYHYTDIQLNRDADAIVPGHMELDANKNWLYIADTDGGRILKVDIRSGEKVAETRATIRRMHGEPLAEFGEMVNVNWEVLASGFQKPSGLAIRNGVVYVSDYAANTITAIDAATGRQLGNIRAEAEGIMGIAFGPDGRLWYVDHPTSRLYQIIPR